MYENPTAEVSWFNSFIASSKEWEGDIDLA